MDIRVVLFDDNKHIRESLQMLISATPGITCIGTYPDCRDMLIYIESDVPDVVLMDIEMPGMNGIEAVKLIKQHFPGVQILMQTMFDDDDYIFEAICSGASGYILKTTTPLGYTEAIKNVHAGGSPMSPSIARKVFELFKTNLASQVDVNYNLTDKEKEILQNLVKGKSYKMIAEEMSISTETVKTHMKNIYTKLHVNSNTEAVVKAIKDKII
ncbi:MAG TPA: response regulator transcription factor [Chitinophagales bacterium]|nr:response regulator transcription factor [Chitinophagales bacterium]HMU70120.1 response regulator transcription factor [Chitinophagales bacterium]HMX03792.1 response regulator transcription factor [Chitinophagales bacterium]HMZ88894.1 response regulator transcription factor [Chitinophagales bacterium]HNA56790.1 response regulator transcription factor [Chitinophagales bacterium]